MLFINHLAYDILLEELKQTETALGQTDPTAIPREPTCFRDRTAHSLFQQPLSSQTLSSPCQDILTVVSTLEVPFQTLIPTLEDAPPSLWHVGYLTAAE